MSELKFKPIDLGRLDDEAANYMGRTRLMHKASTRDRARMAHEVQIVWHGQKNAAMDEKEPLDIRRHKSGGANFARHIVAYDGSEHPNA